MLFWKSFSKRWTVKIISLKQILNNFDQFPCKLYPVLDQNSSISIPYPRAKCLKTLPFTAAHTYIAYIWECPPVWKCLGLHRIYSRTPVTRTRITRTPPLTRTESQFPWIWPNFSVIFTRLTRTRITRKPRELELHFVSLDQNLPR